ncbi:unnamed protein product [Arctogadus glacialis]
MVTAAAPGPHRDHALPSGVAGGHGLPRSGYGALLCVPVAYRPVTREVYGLAGGGGAPLLGCEGCTSNPVGRDLSAGEEVYGESNALTNGQQC